MISTDFEDELDQLIAEGERKKYTLLELVQYCTPFVDEHFFLTESALEDGLPKIQNRYYSMLDDPYFSAEEGKMSDQCSTFKICFTQHKFKNTFEKPQEGLCTGYLSQRCQVGDEVRCHISKNTRVLKLPQQLIATTKLLFICMGTGVVPFISMLERIENTQ